MVRVYFWLLRSRRQDETFWCSGSAECSVSLHVTWFPHHRGPWTTWTCTYPTDQTFSLDVLVIASWICKLSTLISSLAASRVVWDMWGCQFRTSAYVQTIAQKHEVLQCQHQQRYTQPNITGPSAIQIKLQQPMQVQLEVATIFRFGHEKNFHTYPISPSNPSPRWVP